jgi:hypothetical protein
LGEALVARIGAGKSLRFGHRGAGASG